MTSEFASVAFGLASAATWGVGDFSGGLATRRASTRAVIVVSQTVGLFILIGFAILRAEAAPIPADIFWGAAAGIAGQIGLLAFYRALAIGQMGIAAPVTAVLCAAIPALFSALTQGMPDAAHLAGFGLALAGIWLISRPGDGAGRPAGIGLALIGGCGFGGFLLLIAQVQPNSVFWPLAAARAASIALQLGLTAAGQRLKRPARHVLPLIALSGTMDAGGNVFFVLAEQAGRLDVASVLSSLYPATTVLLALVILKEKLKPWQLTGVLLALIAVPLIAAR